MRPRTRPRSARMRPRGPDLIRLPPPLRPLCSVILVASGTVVALSLAFTIVNAIDKIPIGEPYI